MEFTSISFLLFIASVVFLYNLVPNVHFRKFVLCYAGILFIGSFCTTPEQLIPLIAFLSIGYAMMECMRHTRSWYGLSIAVGVVLVTFIYLKRYVFLLWLPAIPYPYLIIGLSYILFRLIDLIVRTHAAELAVRPGIVSYFNYTCNFLCFVSGPIQKYPDHLQAEGIVAKLNEDIVYRSLARIITGYFKVAVVSAVADYLFMNWSTTVVLTGIASVETTYYIMNYLLSVVSYTAYLYYNFSGYMDIVIGIGWLLGQSLPENFNKPFAAKSFLEFWTRWHMTLSEWFKVYLFNPLLQTLAQHFTSANAMIVLGVLTFFITFLVMGVWHGSTEVFVVYGLLMGLGASLNKLWQILMIKKLGKKQYKIVAGTEIYGRLSRGLTFAYFSLAVTCLWVNIDQLAHIAYRLNVTGALATCVSLMLAAAVVGLAWDFIAHRVTLSAMFVAAKANNFATRSLWLAYQILFIVTVMSFFHKSPEFVYKAF